MQYNYIGQVKLQGLNINVLYARKVLVANPVGRIMSKRNIAINKSSLTAPVEKHFSINIHWRGIVKNVFMSCYKNVSMQLYFIYDIR